MRIYFAVLGAIFLLLGALINNRRKALTFSSAFLEKVYRFPEEFKSFVRDISEKQIYCPKNIFVPKKTYVYLITRTESGTVVVSLNNKHSKTFLDSQYEKIVSRMQDGVYRTYSFDSYSVYYSLKSGGKDSLLKMEHAVPFPLKHRYSGH